MPDSRFGNAVVPGPKAPSWSCGCGAADNWACRIRCRKCGRDAPHRIRLAAEKASKSPRGAEASNKQHQHRQTSAWAAGPPGGGKLQKVEARLKALEEENQKLRANAGGGAGMELEEDADEEVGPAEAVDLQALQELLQATIKAYGADSAQAKEKAAELAAARAARRSAKSVSVQLRAVERRADRQRKAVEKAKAAEVEAQAAVQAAQSALAEASSRVTAAEDKLQAVEAELQNLCQRAAAELSVGDAKPAPCQQAAVTEASLPWLAAQLEGDEEAQAAVALLRRRVAARQVSKEAAGGAAKEAEDAGMEQADIQELERQAKMAKQQLEAAESRLKGAREGSTAKHSNGLPAPTDHGPVRTHSSHAGAGTGPGPYARGAGEGTQDS